MPYAVTDRRPIAARRVGVFNRLATALAAAGVSANAISIIGMLAAIAAGLLLAFVHAWWTYLLVAAFVQLRLLANLLDGMVAIAANRASALGELFNEVPDRVSDSAVLIGLGFAAGASPMLGAVAAVLAVMTAYVRTVGKAAGLPSDFRGPMAKQHRMAVVTAWAIVAAIVPSISVEWHLPLWALGVIVVGSLLTCLRRLVGIAGQLRGAT
jgi:phosphatidylglycerophosphate synthase